MHWATLKCVQTNVLVIACTNFLDMYRGMKGFYHVLLSSEKKNLMLVMEFFIYLSDVMRLSFQ